MIPVLALVGALGLLILTAACGNLGSLLLARGVARQQEIAIRVAVGAGRARLVRQLFTESLLLALLGSAAGLALGFVVQRVLMTWAEVPVWIDASPDRRVIAFAVTLGFAAAILFGLAPAWQASRQRARGTVARQVLVGIQVAASCVLLIVAGLLVRAMDHAIRADAGFDYRQVISVDPALRGYTPAAARAYFTTLDARLRGVPGIESVALVSNPPLGNRWTVFKAEIAGRAVNLHVNHVDPAFLGAMKIPVLRGRNLVAGDTRAIVVSESLARLRWPAEDPLGKSFKLAGPYDLLDAAPSARRASGCATRQPCPWAGGCSGPRWRRSRWGMSSGAMAGGASWKGHGPWRGRESRAAYSSYAAGAIARSVHYLGRLRRIQRMIDSVLPIMHSAENPTMNQVISGKFAMPRIRRPNQMATSPMRVNRTVRKPKT